MRRHLAARIVESVLRPAFGAVCPICRRRSVAAVWVEDGETVCFCPWCRHGHTAGDDGPPEYWGEKVRVEPAYWEAGRQEAFDALLEGLRPRRLLDWGCGPGVFVERAVARGVDAYGYDPSEAVIRHAQQRSGVGDRVSNDPVRFDACAPFDLITLWDVLEHTTDPVGELDRLRRRLQPGGRLFVQVPNLLFHLPYQGGKRLLGRGGTLQPLHHRQQFTWSSLRKAVRAAGFRRPRSVELPPTGPAQAVRFMQWKRRVDRFASWLRAVGLQAGHALRLVALR